MLLNLQVDLVVFLNFVASSLNEKITLYDEVLDEKLCFLKVVQHDKKSLEANAHNNTWDNLGITQ